jgi:hypothetical protein
VGMLPGINNAVAKINCSTQFLLLMKLQQSISYIRTKNNYLPEKTNKEMPDLPVRLLIYKLDKIVSTNQKFFI